MPEDSFVDTRVRVSAEGKRRLGAKAENGHTALPPSE